MAKCPPSTQIGRPRTNQSCIEGTKDAGGLQKARCVNQASTILDILPLEHFRNFRWVQDRSLTQNKAKNKWLNTLSASCQLRHSMFYA
eukprot:g49981.t1